MKKKISIAIIIIAVIVAAYFLFVPSPVDQQRVRESAEVKQTLEQTKPETSPPPGGTAATTARAGLNAADQAQRMHDTYQVLQQERSKLSDQLSNLRAQLFDLKLPAKQAEEYNKKMMKAYMLINNPPMLGAFNNVNDIHDEIDRVKAAQEDLDEVGKGIAAAKGSNK